MTTTTPNARGHRLALVLASALSLLGAVLMRSWSDRDLPAALWLPTGLLALAAALVHHRRSGSQLLARAILWSNLLLGTLIAVSSSARDRPVAVGLSLATGLALLLLGRRGLEADGAAPGTFVPVAFRGTLVALLVMALADAQSLLLFGTLRATGQGWHVGSVASKGLPFLLAGALLAGVVGLYRLRVWGLVAAVLAGVATATAALLNAFDFPTVLNRALAATAGLQVLVALPLLAALVTGARPQPRIARGGVILSTVTIAGLMAFSVAAAVGGRLCHFR